MFFEHKKSRPIAEYVRPYLDHPFQNVRNRIGSLLINIFETDLEFPDANAPECPRIGDFIDELLPRLDCLYNDAANVQSVATSPDADADALEAEASVSGPDSAVVAEYKAAIRLFKVGEWARRLIRHDDTLNLFAISPPPPRQSATGSPAS